MKNLILAVLFLLLAQPGFAAYVNPVTGQLSEVIQLIPPQEGPLGLNLALRYSKQVRDKGPLGDRWTHSYDIILNRNSDGTRVFIGGFEEVHFFFAPGLVPRTGDFSKITQNPDGTWTVKLANGNVYQFTDEGKLTSFKDILGNKVTLDHSNPELTIITDPTNHKVVIRYKGDKIDLISGPNAEEFSFFYDEKTGILKTVTDSSRQNILPAKATSFEFNYDGKNITCLKGVNNEITKFEWKNGKVSKVVFPPGVVNMAGDEAKSSEYTTFTYEYIPDKHRKYAGKTIISCKATGLERVFNYDQAKYYFSSYEIPAGEMAERIFYDDVPIIDARFKRLKELRTPGPDGEINVVLINGYDTYGNPTEIITSTIFRDGKNKVKEHLVYNYDENGEMTSGENLLLNKAK